MEKFILQKGKLFSQWVNERLMMEYSTTFFSRSAEYYLCSQHEGCSKYWDPQPHHKHKLTLLWLHVVSCMHAWFQQLMAWWRWALSRSRAASMKEGCHWPEWFTWSFWGTTTSLRREEGGESRAKAPKRGPRWKKFDCHVPGGMGMGPTFIVAPFSTSFYLSLLEDAINDKSCTGRFKRVQGTIKTKSLQLEHCQWLFVVWRPIYGEEVWRSTWVHVYREGNACADIAANRYRSPAGCILLMYSPAVRFMCVSHAHIL